VLSCPQYDTKRYQLTGVHKDYCHLPLADAHEYYQTQTQMLYGLVGVELIMSIKNEHVAFY
jgi:hypothetical protein